MPYFPTKQPFGLYVHIPFCRKKCAYCDFFSLTDEKLVVPFMAALAAEAVFALSKKDAVFDSLHIGGGTPSIVEEKQIVKFVGRLNEVARFCIDSEITVEANPESVNSDWLKSLRQAGVNRVSIGVQSFNDDSLAFLGRIHNTRQAKKAFEAARFAGFDNIGLDIIYGLPGQTRADLEADLNQAVALAPDHLSCYMLTIENGTPLAASLQQKKFRPLSGARLGDMFMTVADVLARNGYMHYEISNFTRTRETRSRHNLKYWRRVDYMGLGPSAHSCRGHERYWNVKSVPDYIDRLSAGRSPRLSGEKLSRHQQMMEAVYLGLRLAEGVDLDAFNREFSVDFKTLFAPVLSEHEQTGKLCLSDGQCRLSTRGMLFHETIASDLATLIP